MQMAPFQLSVRLVLLIAAVCAVFLMIGNAAGAESPPSPAIEYVVQPGDTLWAIAADHSTPHADVRRLISEIRTLSDTGSTIFPGQVLLIPTA